MSNNSAAGQQQQIDDLRQQVARLSVFVRQVTQEVRDGREVVAAAITELEATVVARVPANVELQAQIDQQRAQLVRMAEALAEMSQELKGNRAANAEAAAAARAPGQETS